MRKNEQPTAQTAVICCRTKIRLYSIPCHIVEAMAYDQHAKVNAELLGQKEEVSEEETGLNGCDVFDGDWDRGDITCSTSAVVI